MGITKKSNIAIFSPYLNILGGGERFLLTIAEYLSKYHRVDIFWHDHNLKKEARLKLGIDIASTEIKDIPRGKSHLFFELLKYDHLFYMTDGSLFFSPVKNNYLIIQSPAHIPVNSLINYIKLSRFNKIICYSNYVGNFVRSKLNRNFEKIPPPVLTDLFKPLPKENLIISVGRFFPWLHNKKQEVLVRAFKELIKNPEFKKWKLIIIGSVDKGAENYVQQVIEKSRGFPIEIITDADFNKLTGYYGKAKLYWHAAGFGEDLRKFPERAEHFGITTIEAMSAGCIPFVFNGGGQKEIVTEGKNGFLWNTVVELTEKTSEFLIKKDQYTRFFQKTQIDSKLYSKEVFINRLNRLTDTNER